MNGVQLHDFDDKLAQSHAAADLPFWGQVYKEAFPKMRDMIDTREDGWHQRAGIDRRIILDPIGEVFIDEKVRGRDKRGNVYEDIALEYVSNDRRNDPGWVCKPLAANYIAYAIAPIGLCYLLPVTPLQEAWRRYGEAWLAEYRKPFHCAPNKNYTTLFVPVPVPVLFAAIGNWHRVKFEPVEVNGILD